MAIRKIIPILDRKTANDVAVQVATAFVAVWKIRVPVRVFANGLESGHQHVAV
ncbi:MAG: hypothetical protein ABIZ56_01405 [Chthoniobacteraceae bacterium]